MNESSVIIIPMIRAVGKQRMSTVKFRKQEKTQQLASKKTKREEVSVLGTTSLDSHIRTLSSEPLRESPAPKRRRHGLGHLGNSETDWGVDLVEVFVSN